MSWKFGVNAALELGVADVCCRFGMVPFAYVPSIAIKFPKHMALFPEELVRKQYKTVLIAFTIETYNISARDQPGRSIEH